jgi:hypothetical protein
MRVANGNRTAKALVRHIDVSELSAGNGNLSVAVLETHIVDAPGDFLV